MIARSRILALVALLAAVSATCLTAGTLPDKIGTAAKSEASGVSWADYQLGKELGFVEGERGKFGEVEVTIWKFKDSTGAYSGMLTLQSGDVKPVKNWLETSVAVGPASYGVVGNLLLEIKGQRPPVKDLTDALQGVAGRISQDVPALPSWLPQNRKVAGSERFVIGPVGAQRFLSGLQAGDVNFEQTEEAMVAQYGDQKLTVLSYPTPQRARQVEKLLRARGEQAVKRDGVLVAVVFGSTDAKAVESILNGVKYSFSVSELLHIPKIGPRPWDFIVAFAQLFALIMSVCLVVGFSLAGFRWWREQQPTYRPGDEYTSMKLNE